MGALGTLLLTIVLVAGVYFCIHYFGEKHSREDINKILEEYDARKKAEENVRMRQYTDSVEIHLNDFYSSMIVQWNKPQNPLTVDILRYKSEKEIAHAQSSIPNEWFLFADSCDCWIFNDTLCILEQMEVASEKAKSYPESFDSTDKIGENIIHISIPLPNIHYFKSNGMLTRSERTVVPGSVSYTGVSVNGIGFGEVKHTPELTVPDLKDSRYITLYYHVEETDELQALYLGYDSLDTLIRVFPQFEKQ